MKHLRLAVERDRHVVPATVWLPDAPAPRPVVLLGHGGSGHREAARHTRMARHLVENFEIATLAIDGTFHGERRHPGDGPLDYQQRVLDEGPIRVHERMREDWLAALNAVSDAGLVDASPVGYFGMSMGARYGIPTCAALGSRLRSVVLGKFGLRSAGIMQRMAADPLIRASAEAITAPALLHMPWDDEVFPRAGQFELFDQLGATDKQLWSRPGGHASQHPYDEQVWCAHLAHHVSGSRAAPRGQ